MADFGLTISDDGLVAADIRNPPKNDDEALTITAGLIKSFFRDCKLLRKENKKGDG